MILEHTLYDEVRDLVQDTENKDIDIFIEPALATGRIRPDIVIHNKKNNKYKILEVISAQSNDRYLPLSIAGNIINMKEQFKKYRNPEVCLVYEGKIPKPLEKVLAKEHVKTISVDSNLKQQVYGLVNNW